MEFRLIYKGPLPPERWDEGRNGRSVGRAKEKHKLRKYFHPQLRELWDKDPVLKLQADSWFLIYTTPSNMRGYPGPGVRQATPVMPNTPGAKKYLDHIADCHIRMDGNRFIPLVSKDGGFYCALDILFLRRDGPGNFIGKGGDIDNRIKVLLDGLRMPEDEKELGGCKIEADEDPFYCLLEDDKLISKFSVTTDRLIMPRESAHEPDDVELVIHVSIVNPGLVFAGGRLL